MSTFFHSLLTAGITAGWIVAAVLLLRLVFKRAPRWITVALWGLVAVRLLVPIHLESPVSVVPSTRVERAVETVVPSLPTLTVEEPTPTLPIAPPETENTAPSAPAVTGHPSPAVWSTETILTAAWGVGVLAMLLYAVISTALLYRRVRDAVKQQGRVYQSDRASSPFVLGVLRPRIYLPCGLDTEERLFVIAHEEAHIKRLDHLWKPFGFLLLSVYWFQPLLWVAYWCLCRDIETACDERVVKTLSADERKQYSYTLVSLGRERRRIAACPVAFGEVGLKERVKRVMSYKKPAVWIIAVAVLLTVAASVCLLTNRQTEEPSRGTFEGATLRVESDPYQQVTTRSVDVEVGEYLMLEDSSDELMKLRIDEVNLDEMTITVGFSKPLWVDGVKSQAITIPYDADEQKICSEDGEYVYRLRLSCPSSKPVEFVSSLIYFDKKNEDHFTQTVYTSGEWNLTLDKEYFAMHFGRLSDHVMYGTYRETEDRLILTEDAGVTEYVFVKAEQGSLRYDAAASYRHKKSNALQPDDGMILEHLYRTEMNRLEDAWEVIIRDWDGREVLSDNTFGGKPTSEQLSATLLRISGYEATEPYTSKKHLYVDLGSMTALETYNRVISDQSSKATASLIESGGMHFIRVVQYAPGEREPMIDTNFRLYSVENIETANVRVWLEEHRLTIAYINKVGKHVVTVYNWRTGERVDSRVHTVGGSVTANADAAIETVFTDGEYRLHYSGITRAFYHIGNGQYADVLTALKDGTLTLPTLVEEIRADMENGALKDMSYYRDGGTRHGTYDTDDCSQSVTLKPQENSGYDIYFGDPYAAVEHHATDPLAFSPK